MLTGPWDDGRSMAGPALKIAHITPVTARAIGERERERVCVSLCSMKKAFCVFFWLFGS